MTMPRRLASLVPLLALAAGAGCFATRSDLLVVQDDIATTRAELLSADTARRAQLDRVISTMTSVQDTLRSINQRFTRFQGEVRGDLTSYGEQLLRVQELLGISQRDLQRLRAELEERSRALPPGAAGVVPAPSAVPGAPPPSDPAAADPNAPGPNQLFELGRTQLQRGSPGAARQAFEELLSSYPDHDLAPDALFYVAEAHAADDNEAAADSAWVRVFTDFPRAPRAAEALYRHGVFLQNGGRTREARIAYERVIEDYPREGAAQLARDRLQTLP